MLTFLLLIWLLKYIFALSVKCSVHFKWNLSDHSVILCSLQIKRVSTSLTSSDVFCPIREWITQTRFMNRFHWFKSKNDPFTNRKSTVFIIGVSFRNLSKVHNGDLRSEVNVFARCMNSSRCFRFLWCHRQQWCSSFCLFTAFSVGTGFVSHKLWFKSTDTLLCLMKQNW